MLQCLLLVACTTFCLDSARSVRTWSTDCCNWAISVSIPARLAWCPAKSVAFCRSTLRISAFEASFSAVKLRSKCKCSNAWFTYCISVLLLCFCCTSRRSAALSRAAWSFWNSLRRASTSSSFWWHSCSCLLRHTASLSRAALCAAASAVFSVNRFCLRVSWSAISVCKRMQCCSVASRSKNYKYLKVLKKSVQIWKFDNEDMGVLLLPSPMALSSCAMVILSSFKNTSSSCTPSIAR